MQKLNILVAGSTGYIGIELTKILIKHDKVKIKYLCGSSSVGKNLSSFDKTIKSKLPKITKFDKSFDLYNKARSEILKLFKKNFMKILEGKIIEKKQKGKILIFKKKDLLKYDKLFLNKRYKLIDLIKINNARTFKNKSFNFFIDNGEKYEFKINIKKLK